MTGPRSPRSASPRKRQLAARLLDGNSLALGTLLAAMLAADASALVRIADLPIGVANGLGNTGNFNGNGNSGNFNGNGNRGNFNGNGNAGSFSGNFNGGNFNGNANCGNGFGNGNASDGNGNGRGTGGTPDWCRFLKDLNGRLGLPPGTIPDFTLK
ncbi:MULTISPECIES: hypothetical protein [Mesorhizobium]|uniref:Uncharacterized protein n=1 Tax=Mesorhizobium abyssinicae TaxID=1209958 RepID=A0ABU5ARN5_9HYPH|nr:MULTISPECIES: hypothetical protein [Mesorhizobium]MDX8539950.1 hypothetical protein [Mesorhizobium abyssinicae]TGQ30693.1 hypothetical protein EN857_26805 [Mesorhizobium sp. M4B.F.Ca.ET.214.01.1.1]TGQ57202.1 hypothetical protein EN854_26670 [Mesorhizobium sp. M4B.F.Ca.ET.211.01.1.1]TGU30502.1 hypothetical protein EN793_26650 [Mesorhizobium sp. M4B.F.Ca.ET.150.01.1.1]